MGGFADFCESLAQRKNAILVLAAGALLLRFAVGLHGYSGERTPPMFGDYEAQRHWMEITLHTPLKEWYAGGPQNNLTYWGLDYPPLTAYQSYLHGCLLHFVDPETVALGTSQGHESAKSKMLMRLTVISSDLFIFFPAALAIVAVYYRKKSERDQMWALAMILMQPGLILIDHGHFQFNSISLGLAMAATAAVIHGADLFGSVLFCLSLNHKQMSMYYAPAFFAHLLGKSLRKKRPLLAVLRLGLVVIATFGVCWAPFLVSKESVLQVLGRLAPLSRGLYEDHVANFWCSTSIFIKWKQLFSIPTLARMALGTTILAALPAMIQQILHPSPRGFLLCLFNSSFAFYLFAFQVHEKSILLPLLPASIMALEESTLYIWFTNMAVFSMFPLLQRDHLGLAYIAILLLFNVMSGTPCILQKALGKWDSLSIHRVILASGVGALILHLLAVFVPPPLRYPYLHPALMEIYSFVHFVLLVCLANWRQWSLSFRDNQIHDLKKNVPEDCTSNLRN